MKYTLAVIILSTFLTSCVGTHATKEVQVHRDSKGRIIKTVHIERAEQNGTMLPFSYEYLKCNKKDKETPKIYH